MKLFLASASVIFLVATLVGTILYRLHKRRIRLCKCCGQSPQRIGQVWGLADPNKGTGNLNEGVKWLALVLTVCPTTGTVHLVKDEQKYFNWFTRQWKHQFEKDAFWPDFELLVRAEETMRVAQLLEVIVLTSGQPGTVLLGGLRPDPAIAAHSRKVIELLERRQRAREGKSLVPVPTLPLRSVTARA
ncbi:MAG: hypothetical protein AAB391_02335 [Patescibacteria group bacterium]